MSESSSSNREFKAEIYGPPSILAKYSARVGIVERFQFSQKITSAYPTAEEILQILRDKKPFPCFMEASTQVLPGYLTGRKLSEVNAINTTAENYGAPSSNTSMYRITISTAEELFQLLYDPDILKITPIET